MYRLERTDFLKSPYIFLWSLLGFQAGYINAFGFTSNARYVSHVTGFGTQIGITLAEHQFVLALEYLGFPLSFIFGSFFSAFFTSARVENNRVPLYGFITGILPVIAGLLWYLGDLGTFGIFGEPFELFHDFALMYGLSFFCGMQNGCFATMTKGQIRTTHLTGISTDIGTDFARLFFGNLTSEEYELTKRTNICRIATFVSFALGSVLSVSLTRYMHYEALGVPMATSLIVCIVVRRIHTLMDFRFKRARLRMSVAQKIS